MEVKTNDIYSEVYSILNLLGDSYINKIPRKALDIIKNERNMNYNPKYDFSIDINSQDIKRETKAMIALLRLSYWCTSEEEKIKLSNQFKENEKRYQELLKAKYNTDNLFKNKNTMKNINEEVKTKQIFMVEYKEKNFLQKIFDKIKHIFKKYY